MRIKKRLYLDDIAKKLSISTDGVLRLSLDNEIRLYAQVRNEFDNEPEYASEELIYQVENKQLRIIFESNLKIIPPNTYCLYYDISNKNGEKKSISSDFPIGVKSLFAFIDEKNDFTVHLRDELIVDEKKRTITYRKAVFTVTDLAGATLYSAFKLFFEKGNAVISKDDIKNELVNKNTIFGKVIGRESGTQGFNKLLEGLEYESGIGEEVFADNIPTTNYKSYYFFIPQGDKELKLVLPQSTKLIYIPKSK